MTNEGHWALSEKEKQTLRLIVRGHDAKSIARSLDLSVHTINERLRDARRKMAVSSSREAARLLLAAEGGVEEGPTPELFGDAEIGEDAGRAPMDQQATPIGGAGRAHRQPRLILGVLAMTLVLGLLALTALPGTTSTPQLMPIGASATTNPQIVDTARQFLLLVDQSRWDESYQMTGAAFRKLNTADLWTSVSNKVRVPLGAAVSRKFLSQQNFPAPPDGYEVVKFRTRFANKPEAVETVTLDREDGVWRVVAVIIE